MKSDHEVTVGDVTYPLDIAPYDPNAMAQSDGDMAPGEESFVIIAPQPVGPLENLSIAVT